MSKRKLSSQTKLVTSESKALTFVDDDTSNDTSNETKYTKTFRRDVWRLHFGNRQSAMCQFCGKYEVFEGKNGYVICHFTAKSNGGGYDLWNCGIGCHACNNETKTTNGLVYLIESHYSVVRLYTILSVIRTYFEQRYPTEFITVYRASVYNIMQHCFGNRPGGIPNDHMLWQLIIKYDCDSINGVKNQAIQWFLMWEQLAKEIAFK
jgi:hypothetical protein